MKKILTKESVTCFKRWSRKGYSAFASMHLHVRIGVLGVGMSIISLASSEANAASVDSLQIIKVIDIDDVGITLERENPTRSAMAQTQLFSRATQAAAPLQTLESALRLSPSIDVRERGGKGMQTDLSIRGGSFDQTMVLLNGINFTDARTGHQTHSLPIDIEAVSGIDLIDGISGVGAYAGAINFRTAPLEPNYARVEMAGGQYGYGYANLSGALTKGRFNLYGVGSLRRSDGYAYNTDFENWNGYLRSTYDSERLGFFDSQVGYQRRAFGSNGFYSLSNPDQFETTETMLGSLRWVKQLGERVRLNSSVSYRKNFDDYEWIKGSPIGNNLHNTDNATAELYADYKWIAAGTTTLGADYTYNHIWSTNMGKEASEPNGIYTHADERSIGNFYLRHTKEWEQFTLSASAGVASSPYGQSPIWSITTRYTPLQNFVIEAGVNESMRLPTFTDLYYSNATRVADENLLPESATTYRLSSGYTRGSFSTSAQVYLREGRNIIDWAQSAEEREENPDIYYSRQITSLSTFGVELSGVYAPKGFVEQISLSYGYISQDKESGDMISLYAQNYMHNKGAASITMNLCRNLTLAVTGSLYDRYGNYSDAEGSVVSYKPYFLLDGRLTWSRNKWRIYLDATNITKSEYFDYGGLLMPQEWISLGLSFTI
ncbi:MAG: TonB-dependent receptor plug domain-containing protein [Rikenellaceae bacterium]